MGFKATKPDGSALSICRLVLSFCLDTVHEEVIRVLAEEKDQLGELMNTRNDIETLPLLPTSTMVKPHWLMSCSNSPTPR